MTREAVRPDTWMPLFIADYLRDTARLTTELHGAYLLLMMDYWVHGRPPRDVDTELAAITRLPLSRWRRVARPALEGFFQIQDGAWSHGRIEKELALAEDRIAVRSDAGRAGAKVRWSGHSKRIGKGNSKRTATAAPEGSEPMRLQRQNDASSPITKESPLVPPSEPIASAPSLAPEGRSLADAPALSKSRYRPASVDEQAMIRAVMGYTRTQITDAEMASIKARYDAGERKGKAA